jgi:hypothetical protein
VAADPERARLGSADGRASTAARVGPAQRYIFEEVGAQLDCPPLYHHGIGHIGPVIMHFGTGAEGPLPARILDSSDWWCQGTQGPARARPGVAKTRAV